MENFIFCAMIGQKDATYLLNFKLEIKNLSLIEIEKLFVVSTIIQIRMFTKKVFCVKGERILGKLINLNLNLVQVHYWIF